MNAKTVEKIVQVPRKSHAEGFSTAQLNHRLLGEYLDPYLMFDHFEMARPFFPPHPHAGFSAVTYMFPRSKNGFINRDSLGNRNVIGPGAIHWTVAGRGVVHEVFPDFCHFSSPDFVKVDGGWVPGNKKDAHQITFGEASIPVNERAGKPRSLGVSCGT